MLFATGTGCIERKFKCMDQRCIWYGMRIHDGMQMWHAAKICHWNVQLERKEELICCRNSFLLLIWSSVFENSRFFNLFSLYIWQAVWLNIWYLVGEYINKDEKYYLEVDDVYESISSLWSRNSIHISSLSYVRRGNGASKRRRVRMWVVVNSNFLNKWYLRNSENIRCVFE